MPSSDYIRTFDSRSMDDVPRVGGKTASLGELYNLLKGAPVSVPAGFAVTAQAYRDALTDACAWAQLSALMEGFDIADVVELARRGEHARAIVYAATGGARLRAQIA